MNRPQRILLKLSGEVLATKENLFDHDKIRLLAKEIWTLVDAGIQVAVVCWWWNIWRWRDSQDFPVQRVKSDYLWMMATVMNAVNLSETIISEWYESHVVTPATLHLSPLSVEYDIIKARKSLQKWRVICCGGWSGNPYFTTDSAAVLRALELECDIVVKATKVDGIYSSDPNKNVDAVRYEKITYEEALQKNIKVMDQSAIGMAKEEWMPLYVCHYETLSQLFSDQSKGTYVVPSEWN
jgi:uridylate kinase